MAAQYFSCQEVFSTGSVWNSCVYTQILQVFENALRAGLTEGVIGASLNLLTILGAMEIAVLVAWMALSDEDQYITDTLCALIRIGIYAQLIANCLPWGLDVATGAIEMGLLLSTPASIALGITPLTTAQLHDPGALMLLGFKLFTPLITYVENLGVLGLAWHTVTATLYGIIAIVGVACIIWIGLNILVGWVELLLLLGFGTPMHAFAIFTYTRFLSIGMLQTQAAAAVRLGVHAALAGLMFPLMSALQVTDPTDPTWDTAFAAFGISLVCGYLSYRTYQLASLMTGGQSAYTGAGLVMLAHQSSHVAHQVSVVGSAMSHMAHGLNGGMPSRTARS